MLYQQYSPSLTKEYYLDEEIAFFLFCFFFLNRSIKLTEPAGKIGGDCGGHQALCKSEQLYHLSLGIFLSVCNIAEAGMRAQVRLSCYTV